MCYTTLFMASDTKLIALSLHLGEYAIVSTSISYIDLEALRAEGRLVDVTDDHGYSDWAAILSSAEFEKYLLPPSNLLSESAREWYAALPHTVQFVLVHVAEWESGLN